MAYRPFLPGAVVPFFALLLPLPAQDKEKDNPRAVLRRAVAKVRPAVVVVRPAKAPAKGKAPGPGLGALLSPKGLVLTPRRHVEGAGPLEVALGDGRKLAAKVVFKGPDVAFLRVASDRPLPFVGLGDSDNLKVGDFVFSLGAGFGPDEGPTVEAGLFRGRRASGKDEERLFMDSALSAPPQRELLFNLEGKLVGAWAGRGAVPSNRLKEVVRRLLEKAVRRG
jgi:serine protease Do